MHDNLPASSQFDYKVRMGIMQVFVDTSRNRPITYEYDASAKVNKQAVQKHANMAIYYVEIVFVDN
jgi:hypothetical protein